MLTQSELKRLLSYNPKTGAFVWKVSLSSRACVGKVVGSGKTLDDYIRISIHGKRYLCHRLAVLYMVGVWPKKDVDHKNRIKTDNRWKNLRPASNSENHVNVGLAHNNTSGVTGVTWDKSRLSWKASICVLGKVKNLGRFRKFEDAYIARLFGELFYFENFTPKNKYV